MTPQEIEQIIEMLVEKLGPIGGQVWAIYVRQVYVDIIGSTIWMLAFLVSALVSAYWLRKGILSRRERRGSPVNEDEGTMLIGGTLGFAICLLLTLCAFTFGVLRIVNPEYHALQALLGR